MPGHELDRLERKRMGGRVLTKGLREIANGRENVQKRSQRDAWTCT